MKTPSTFTPDELVNVAGQDYPKALFDKGILVMMTDGKTIWVEATGK